jgi:predicted RNase H-like nuclease (RuvC/YqgF family)
MSPTIHEVDVTDLATRCSHLEGVVEKQDDTIAMLAEDLGIARTEIARLNKELERKGEVIASQLVRIEELDNQLQNKLVDISALEDTISDRDTVRRSVKFNVTHMLQSALAVLNGL